MAIDFVAIDFETANSERDSACSLGVACVENGEITRRYYTLLNPDVSFYEFCTYIHGITEKTVRDAPRFQEIFPALYELLDGKTVVAHNVGFDVGVLEASCRSRHLPVPSVTSFDSVNMARIAWPGLEKHKLSVLAKYFDLPLKNHNAVEDATACAMVVLLACEEFGAKSLDELQVILDKKALSAGQEKPGQAKNAAGFGHD